MRWPSFWGSSNPGNNNDNDNNDAEAPSLVERVTSQLPDHQESKSKSPLSNLLGSKPPTTTSTDDLFQTLLSPTTYTSPSVLVPTILLTTLLLSTIQLSRRYLSRFPSASHIPPSFFRHRSLFGRVTSVGDADNFRLYHTPGGRLAGWGWLRRIPTDPKSANKTRPKFKVKADETIHVRIAGVDAPELAHFGQPAQPYGEEALAFLRQMVDGKRVRVCIWRPDQYGRVVGTVYVRRWWPFGFLWRTDVGLAMLKAGMATVYEAKSGAEFGGKKKETEYRKIESWARTKGKGLWSLKTQKGWESPRMFKDRTKKEGQQAQGQEDQGVVGNVVKTTRSWLMFWK